MTVLHCSSCAKPKPDGIRVKSAHNSMDPGDVPGFLPKLTNVEEMLPARINPVLTIFKTKGHQTGYSGHVIHFPQDVNEIARRVPRLPAELTKNIVVVKRNTLTTVTELNVNSQALRNWLLWLKQHNPCYADVEVSEHALTVRRVLQ